MNYFIMAKFF